MKIVSVEPIGISIEKSEQIRKEFIELGHDFYCYMDRKEDEETLKERMHDADVVVISNIKLSSEVLKSSRKLKMLSVAFTGLDHIDLDYCTEHNIKVVNASGYATVGVAELAIGLMIDVCRHITLLDQDTRNGKTRNNFLGRQLRGKTIGIIGTGAIGLETAILLKAMGCNIIAWSRTEREEVKKLNIKYVSLKDLMKESDIISLHVPLNKETYHLINRDLLSLCKKDAILINTARGNVVDMEALAESLREGLLAGAGIDVFETEPPLAKNHPLINAPNCILTPHIAYATREAFDIRIDIVINNIKFWLNS
ncbi:Erythronate-4-phosphate dehydrogenase [bioreactor metagenome]|uniref:Erythronate-4-phosphate dehydrogenase n=1 Tax=bioreactor metagenome TaxID=1076179 RepID=A0A644UEZ4_9ZZZZ